MSCLKKVIDTIETECGKSLTNAILWSNGMGTQFRSRFTFQLFAGTLLLNKSLYWFYNERHHGKGPMDGMSGTIKNATFQKVKSGQILVHTPKGFSDASMKFVPSIITVYLPRWEEIIELEPSGTIHPQNTVNLQIYLTDQWQRRLQYRIFQDDGEPGSLSHSMVQQHW